MYCSVKFLDPIVRSICPLSGFDWIRLSSVLAVVLVSALVDEELAGVVVAAGDERERQAEDGQHREQRAQSGVGAHRG